MSGTKIKTLLKNLKTQNETTIETFQELPLTIQDDSYVTPVNLKVSLTADSVDLRPEDGGIGLGISASTISLGSSTTVVGSTLTATNISFTGNLEGLSQDTIESDGDITLIPGADSLVKILKESADGSAVGMLIRKPNQGSAVITMGESADGTEDHSYTNGFRLAYQGDGVTGETQGLDYNDMGAIQALDVTSVTDGGVTTYTQNIHNVMEWSRAGEDVKVSSKDDLKLEFKWRNNGYPYAQLDVDLSDKFVDVDPQTKYPILKSTVSGTEHNNFSTSSTSLRSYRDLILTVGMGFNDNTNLANESQSPPKISICKPTFTNYDMLGEVEVASIDHTGKASFSKLILTAPDFDTTNTTEPFSYFLGIDDDGVVRKKWKYPYTADFFTGSHSYYSSELLETGSCVQLTNDSLSLVASASSTVCSGIVNKVIECSEENPARTSLGQTLTSGYVVTVLSVGDSRHEDCQGFNVCNENGDIQPGDLLVTSNIPGYLMKQDDDIIRSCTVGKAMEQVTFDENGQATGVYGYLYCG